MTLNIGVVGTGAIGKEHIDRLTNRVANSKVVAVYDLYEASAQGAVEKFKLDAKIHATDDALINDPNVDAVVITSLGEAHYSTIMKAIAAGKYIFTEKPMTTSAKDSKSVVDAEMRHGKRLIQVGFNRRYDKGYRQLKTIIDSGRIGLPLLTNCRHYNATVPDYYTTEMCVRDTLIHEIDIMHYLLNDDYKSVVMYYAKKNSQWKNPQPRDPQIFHIETKSGIAIVVEVFVTDKYGYDIQCRVVGETGIVSLPEVASCEVRTEGRIEHSIFMDWQSRFIEAYDIEFQAFVDSVLKLGKPAIPSAWDGYIASVTSDACVSALHQPGVKVDISLEDKPDFYKDE